jgi:hypothetical protein
LGLARPSFRLRSLARAGRLDGRTVFRLARANGLDGWAVIRLNGGAVGLAGASYRLAGTVFRNAGAVWLHKRGGDGAGDCRDGTRGCDQGRTALVHVIELLTILCGFALVLNLRGHGWNTRAAVGCDLGWLRAYVDAAATAVVGDAIVVDGRVVHDDRAVVDVGDPRGVDVVDGAVVVEVITLPVATVVAVAGVAVAVIDSAVEADVLTPEAAVQDVAVAEEAPVGGCPKGAVEGRSAPCARDPVVADGSIRPVAGGPEIVGGGSFGLLVDRERRRRLVGFFDGLLAGVYLIV